MRSVASFAILLLLLALAVDFATWSQVVESERVASESNAAARTVRIFSSGWRLPLPTLGTRRVAQGAFVDETWYYMDTALTGMRVVTVPPNGGEVSIDNFDVGASDEEVRRFGAMLADTPVDTVLAMSSFRSLGPRPGTDDERRESIGVLLRGLGARSAPEETSVSCFAFLCVRRPRGFVPLAERYSITQGVSLAFHLNRDLSTYDSHVPRTIIDNRRVFELKLEAAQGTEHSVEANRRLAEVGHRAIRARTLFAEPARLTWTLPDRDALGDLEAATFAATIGLHWSSSSKLKAVRFVLFVDGEEMGSRIILRDGGEQMQWIAWEELLAPGLEQIESVTIEVDQVGEKGPAAIVYITEPRLTAGQIESL